MKVVSQFQAPKAGMIVYDASNSSQATLAKEFAAGVVNQVNTAFGELPLMAVALSKGSQPGARGEVLAAGVSIYTIDSLSAPSITGAFVALLEQWLSVARRR